MIEKKMENEKIYEMIESFFHGELSKSEESFLFSMLADNPEATEQFKRMVKFSEAINNSREDIPSEVENKILSATILKVERKQSNKMHLISVYLFAMALIFISFFFYEKFDEYNKKINDVEKIVNYQNEVISLFLNSLPAANVNETLNNEVIVKKNL